MILENLLSGWDFPAKYGEFPPSIPTMGGGCLTETLIIQKIAGGSKWLISIPVSDHVIFRDAI